MSIKIPVPITFNTHKHHFYFLLNRIEEWKNYEWIEVETELLKIGDNLTDLYTGKKPVEDICNECLNYLKRCGVNTRSDLIKWLHPTTYKSIDLSDSSEWIIRVGNDPERFIHIHPAKNSALTVRVRAGTLKTVLTLMSVVYTSSPPGINSLKLVNQVRTQYLHLSPIKSLDKNKGILKLWNLFRNQELSEPELL